MTETCGRFIVYALVDPRTNDVRYIGKSINGMSRCRAHTKKTALAIDKTHKGNWIRSLQSLGLTCEIRILEDMIEPSGLADAEIKWIAHGRALSWPLTNHTDGGDGMLGHRLPAEARAKIGDANRRRVISDETRSKMRAFRLGKPNRAIVGDKNGARTKREKICRGEGHWAAKLTDNDVLEIKRRAVSEIHSAIAIEFGISTATMSRVVNGIAWSDPATKDAAVAKKKGKPRITRETVRQIRDRVASGEMPSALATEFGMCDEQVRRVVRRDVWKNVP